MTLIALVAALALGATLWRLLPRWLGKRDRRRAVQELLHLCEGDQDLVERLLWQEMQQTPDIDYATAARRAAARLRKDRR